MRVAFLNRKRDIHAGGDLTQIDATMTALRAMGVECEYAPEGWSLDWLRTFDLAHVFHINFPWSTYNWSRCVEADVPYVMTPIFYPTAELGADTATMRRALYSASWVMPNSHAEAIELMKVCDMGPFVLFDYPPMRPPIPNGTDSLFAGEHSAANRDGVLCVTPRAGDKNTDLVRDCCETLGLPFTVATGIEDRDKLAYIYRQSLVFVNASSSERMSLTTGEALVAGCRVVDTTGNRGGEWYGQGLVRVDPANVVKLRDAIHLAYHQRSWDYSPNVLARKLTWSSVARDLVRIYVRVVDGGGRRFAFGGSNKWQKH